MDISNASAVKSSDLDEALIFAILRWLANKDSSGTFFPSRSFCDLNWSRTIEICSKNRILGFLAYAAQAQGWPSSIPADTQNVLKDALQEYSFLHAEKKMQFKEISHLLEEEKFKIIPLKGIILSYLVYNEMPYRVMGDIDIFVQLEHYDRAVQVLESNHVNVPPARLLKNRWQTEVINDALVNIGAYNVKPKRRSRFEGRKTILDLIFERHFFIGNQWVNLKKDFFNESCAVPLPMLGKNICVLPPSRQLLFLVMHAAEQTSPRLEQLLDIALFMHKIPDALSFFDREIADMPLTVRIKLMDFCTAVNEIFYSKAPLAELSENSKKIWQDFFRQNRLNNGGRALFSLIKSRKEKIKFILGYILPNPDYYETPNILAMYSSHWSALGKKIWKRLGRKMFFHS